MQQKTDSRKQQSQQNQGTSFQNYLNDINYEQNKASLIQASENSDQKQIQSNYKGQLPSQKYFTNKELNNLANIKRKPDIQTKKYTKEELRSANKQSKTSQGSEQIQKGVALNNDQEERLKKLSARPFSVKSKQSSRPQTAQSEQSKENQYQEQDDLDQISIPDIDMKEREELLRRLEQREKAQEELNLDECFNSLRQKLNGNDDAEIESLASQTFSSIRNNNQFEEESKKVNFYKPNLKKKANQDHSNIEMTKQIQQKNTQIQTQELVPLEPSNRLDLIYQQIKDLQNFKDEIMDDLNVYMDEIESGRQISLPQQFDEVVDIVINEQRDKAEQKYQDEEDGNNQVEEIKDETGKPFWMNFFKQDYLEESGNNQQDNSQTKEEIEKQRKMKIEYDKIRLLDSKLAQANKVYRELKTELNKKKESIQQQETIKEETKKQRSSKGFLQSKNEPKAIKSSQSKPPSSSISQRKRQSQKKEDNSNTFLTDINKGKISSKQSQKSQSCSEIDEEDLEELQDVVYDQEQSYALMQIADDYLNQDQQPLLSLPPNEQSEQSFNNISRMTNQTLGSNKNFLKQNKEAARNYNPYKKPMYCDQLDMFSRQRLDKLMKDIDENEEQIQKEKEEYYDDQNKSQLTKYQNDENAYLYSIENQSQMERINDSLRKIAPIQIIQGLNFQNNFHKMIEQSDFDSQNQSVIRSRMEDRSQFMNDNKSLQSLPLTSTSRRSNLTMITMNTLKTNLTKLPKEKNLRLQAEKRIVQNQLKDIEMNLRKINQTDDLSYSNQKEESKKDQSIENLSTALVPQKMLVNEETLMRLIDECREEEERRSIMMEMNNESQSETESLQNSQYQLQKFDITEQKLNEANQIISNLELMKIEYQSSQDNLEERQSNINNIAQQLEKISDVYANKDKQIKGRQDLKTKLLSYQSEIDSYLKTLDQKEQFYNEVQEKSQLIEDQILNYEANKHKDIQEVMNEDEEEDEVLNRVLRDLEEYKKVELEYHSNQQTQDTDNQQLLENIQNQQIGRDDNQNELMIAVKQEFERIDNQNQE